MRFHPSPTRRTPRPVRRACLLAAALALAACDDAPVTAPSHDGARLSTGFEQLRDEAIDLGDTWLLTEATTTTSTVVQYDAPTWDPGSGTEVTSLALPEIIETQRTEAGYGMDGVIRINEYFSGDSVSGVAHVQIVGDSVAYFDAGGQPRLDLPGSELIATLGTFHDAVVTDSMVVPDPPPVYLKSPAPSDPLLPPSLGDAAPAYSVAGAGQAARREIVSDLDGPGMRGRRVRYYRRGPQAWVLDEERKELRQEGEGATFTTTEVTRYHRVAWRNDLGRDEARRARARMAAADEGVRRHAGSSLTDFLPSASTSGASPVSSSVPSSISRSVAALPAGATTQSNVTYWLPSPETQTRYPSAPFSVAMQHGAFSGSATWSVLAPSLTDGFNVDFLLRESTDWRKALESQAQELHGRLASSGRRNFLVVGHSNGGLVARRAAQLSAAAGDSLVRGVVTIASPHGGVPLAKVGRETVRTVMTAQIRSVLDRINGSCWRGQFSWLCEIANLTSAELPGQIANFAMDAAVPMSRDVQPGSPFLTALSTTPEAFRRYSIEIGSQGQWKFLRLFGDWRCDPSSSCGGNRLQNAMESVYEILRICGSNSVARLRLGHVSDKCRNARWALSSLNAQYERWTAPGDESDGLIPLKSQQYPGGGSLVRFTRRNSKDSHAGELRSSRVKTDLLEAVTQFLTP